MTGLPARTQRVSRARFNFSGTKTPSETSSASKPTIVQDVQAPAFSTEVAGLEPAAKVRKLEKVDPPQPMPQPMPIVPAATPIRNMIALPSGSDWSGVTVCFATELTTIPQAEAEARLLAAGAKVGPAVSQRTSILVLGGNGLDGKSANESAKYQRFKDLEAKGKVHAKVLAEAAFLSILPGAASQNVKQATLKTEQRPVPETRPARQDKGSRGRNWVDSFSPSKLDDLVGNQPAIRKLTCWLQDWEDVVFRGKSKKLAFQHGSAPDNLNVTCPSFFF